MPGAFSSEEAKVKNKKMTLDLRQLLAELKMLTYGKLEITNMEDNSVELNVELTEEQFEELRNWLHSKRYINSNGAINQIAHFMDCHADLVYEEWAKVDSEYRYIGDKIYLAYYVIRAPDGRYILLKKITFYRGKERAED